MPQKVSRRRFIEATVATTALAASANVRGAAQSRSNVRQPNVLFIVARALDAVASEHRDGGLPVRFERWDARRRQAQPDVGCASRDGYEDDWDYCNKAAHRTRVRRCRVTTEGDTP